MSGWLAVVRLDGGPIDAELLRRAGESMHGRGPDRTGLWIGDGAGFVHTLLATTPEAEREEQPLVWERAVFAGDVRVDARGELVARLRSLGCDLGAEATDPELILHAWMLWGRELPAEVIGDYSFVVWDRRERVLLAVRDRFARRPLFFAEHDEALLVTNDLPSLLAIPSLARELDEHAVADFLLFGRNLHAERTTFEAIRRVPAASRMIASAGGRRVERYWSIPRREEPRTIAPSDAYAEFRDVFARSVGDRSRAGRLLVSLSGGLDSNAVASTLVRVRERAGITAMTTVWRGTIHDEEDRFAAEAARFYGIPIEIHEAGPCQPYQRWDDPLVRGLEPTDEPCSAPFFDFVRSAAQRTRVILTGEGGDPMLYASHDYFFRLLTRMRWARLLRESAGYALTRRRRPPLNLRSQLLKALGVRGIVQEYPRWIEHDLEKRLRLRERWAEVIDPRGPLLHAYRHDAWRLLDSPSWSRTFEAADAGATGVPVEWLSPYFDARVVEFLFSLPPMPYFANKDLVREAFRGMIPESIRKRPKTPLSGDPASLAFRLTPGRWIDVVEQSTPLQRFINRRVLCYEVSQRTRTQYQAAQQSFAVGLALWLNARN